jgi:hypothetical protein
MSLKTRFKTPQERDKTTGQPKPALLKKGKETFELIERYLKVFNTLFENDNYNHTAIPFASIIC